MNNMSAEELATQMALQDCKGRMAGALAIYLGYYEARYRDGGEAVLRRLNEEGWRWSDDNLCWIKPDRGVIGGSGDNR